MMNKKNELINRLEDFSKVIEDCPSDCDNAALLCSAKLDQYPAIIHHESKETEEN